MTKALYCSAMQAAAKLLCITSAIVQYYFLSLPWHLGNITFQIILALSILIVWIKIMIMQMLFQITKVQDNPFGRAFIVTLLVIMTNEV